MPKILVVDDDRDTCQFIAEVLAAPGREFDLAPETDRALHLARTEPFDLVVCDINLNSPVSGLDVLRAFKAVNPNGQVLLVSGFGTLETAIEAVRAGAFDYISKPFDIAEIKKAVERALHQAETRSVAQTPAIEVPVSEFIGRTPGMLAVYNQIARAADSAVPGTCHRREWYWEGAGGACAAPQQPTRGTPICGDQLRSHCRDAA